MEMIVDLDAGYFLGLFLISLADPPDAGADERKRDDRKKWNDGNKNWMPTFFLLQMANFEFD